MIKTVAQVKEELADREAIRDCLYRYARGTDRVDVELLRSAYWEDALDDHLEFSGTREEFISYAVPKLRAMKHRVHTCTNTFINIQGNYADAESYFYGIHRLDDKDNPRDMVVSGRYLDRFEKRHDEWRIARRFCVADWFHEYRDQDGWGSGPFGMNVAPGGLFPNDVSYSMLKLV